MTSIKPIFDLSTKMPRHHLVDSNLSQTADTEAQFLVVEVSGGVWQCAPVSERPEIVLTGWHVFEVQLPGRHERTRHFAGQNMHDFEGRTSSAIETFDAATSRGTTESGRIYELRGSTGFSGDGEFTWNRWKSINLVTEVVNVTAEIKKMMEQNEG